MEVAEGMNFHISPAVDGDLTDFATITLSERNITHLVGAADIFNPAGADPFLNRLCEDGTRLTIVVNDDLDDPHFKKTDNVVVATVPPSTLKALEVNQTTHDAYAVDGILWRLVVQTDDEHYERREAGPGFSGYRGIV